MPRPLARRWSCPSELAPLIGPEPPQAMEESHLFSDDDGPLTCGHAGQLGEEQQGSEAAMDEEAGEEEAAMDEEEGGGGSRRGGRGGR